MKITIVQGAFFPVPPIMGGAVEKIWFRLGQDFAALGHEVVQISRYHPDLAKEEDINGVKHFRIRGFDQPAGIVRLKILDLLYSIRACRAIPHDSDVVVTNTFFSPWLVAKSLKHKVYVDVQRMPKRQMLWYRNSGRLRACSAAIQQAIFKELPSDRHDQVSFIPNPFPFEPPSDEDRKPKKNRILYCGRVHPEKGIEILLEASSGLEWPITVVGPQETCHGGGGPAYVTELQNRVDLQKCPVTFQPPVFDVVALNQLYNEAAIFVYPSIAETGDAGPVAPREAMAWGCVPVVSDLDCFKDFIIHEHNGLIFNHRAKNPAGELQKALRRLIEDRVFCESLASEAVKVCQTHSPRNVANQFLKDFESMIKARKGV